MRRGGVPFLSQADSHIGQTSRVRCPPPPKLLNGYHRPASNTAGGAKTIEFFCKKSYILSGNHLNTCFTNGSWSSRPPKCVRGSWFDKHIRAGNTALYTQNSPFFYCITVRTERNVSGSLIICLANTPLGNLHLHVLACEKSKQVEHWDECVVHKLVHCNSL